MPEGASSDTASCAGVIDSAPPAEARSKAATGGASLSSMVYVWVVTPPRVALPGPLRVTSRVSAGSSRSSSATVTEMVSAVSPGV